MWRITVDCKLAISPDGSPRNQGLAGHNACIAQKIPCRRIVAGIHHNVIASNQCYSIGRLKTVQMGYHLRIGTIMQAPA